MVRIFSIAFVKDNFVNYNKFCYILKVLFADLPNTKFWFPEFFSSYAWHVTEIMGLSGIELFSAPN